MEVELEINNLGLKIGGQEVLRDIDLTVMPEETLVILGPSGAGKSTLLRAIAGLEKPNSGTIRRGRQVWHDQHYSLPPYQRAVGMVFQELALWPHLTVREHLQLIAPPKYFCPERLYTLLERVGLHTKADRFPSELSGGEKQRLAIARALVGSPRLLLMDEPFSGLDWQIKNEIMKFIQGIKIEQKITLVVVTHDQFEGERIADRVVIMHNSRIVQIGRIRELLTAPKTEFVAKFLEPIRGRES